MKLGYSMILGELLDATRLAYRDCEPFQIVCPSCKEPVFKSERKADDIHFLSHYRADKAYNSECELRVGRITKEKIEEDNKVSRDQRLVYFLSVLRELIAKNPMYPSGPAKSQAFLNRSKALEFFREMLYKHEQHIKYSWETFNELAEEYVTDIVEMGGTIDTAFALGVQKRIAYDIWNHLLTPKGKSNYFFLFNHAYMSILCRIETAVEQKSAVPEMYQMREYMVRIPQASKHKGMMLIAEMGNTPVGPPFAIENSNYVNKTAADVCHEMIGCLLGLPYFDILKTRMTNP